MEKKVYVELPPFTGRNVPITEIAAAMHKDAQYVRIGLQQGILKFGYAIKLENSNEYNYYCPDRKVTPTSTTTTAPTERCGRKLDTSSRKPHKKRALILADENSWRTVQTAAAV